jgi:hypothetical protein
LLIQIVLHPKTSISDAIFHPAKRKTVTNFGFEKLTKYEDSITEIVQALFLSNKNNSIK